MRISSNPVAVIILLLTCSFGTASLADQSYGLEDARYVTGSENPALLEYVVCLKAAVDRQMSGMNLQDAVYSAADDCQTYARRLPQSSAELNAEDIHLNILECGFQPGDASPDMGCDEGFEPVSDPGMGAVREVEEVFLTPQIIEVGKWASGLTHDEIWLWVAESGQRTIARVDIASGRVIDRFKVGRLPVSMTSFRRELFFTLVVTDKIIRRHDEAGRGKILTTLDECPEKMISTRQTLWVLTWPDCSSDKSRIVQIDAINGQQSRSPVLGEWAQDLVVHRNKIWVAHASAGLLSIVDDLSLVPETINITDASFWAIAANNDSIYAAGRIDGTTDDGLVLKIDPTRKIETARAYVTELVTKIIADNEHVIVVGDKGGLWVFDAKSLSLLRTISLVTGEFNPRDAILHEDMLLLSSQIHNGENGAVLVLRDWRPKTLPVGSAPRTSEGWPVGSIGKDGRTFLFEEPLEGVYSNSWTGIRLSGNGDDDTDVHIRSDGKIGFDGIVSLYCGSASGQFWKLSSSDAQYVVPREVMENSRDFFCAVR